MTEVRIIIHQENLNRLTAFLTKLDECIARFHDLEDSGGSTPGLTQEFEHLILMRWSAIRLKKMYEEEISHARSNDH